MNSVFHVGLTVSDVERSIRFYTGLLGFRLESDLELPGEGIDELMRFERSNGVHAVYLTLGSFTLELMRFDPPSADTAAARVFNETGLAHLSILADDPDAVIARVGEFGGSLFSTIGFAHVIRDPDGQLIELLPAANEQRIRGDRRPRG